MTAGQKKIQEARLEWELKTTVEAYNDLTKSSAPWNAPARQALTLASQARVYGADVEGYPHMLRFSLSRAIEQGCPDPLIHYLNLYFSESAQTDLDRAKALGEAATTLNASKYPPARKFYAACAAQSALQGVLRKHPECQREAYNFLAIAHDHLCKLLADKSVPAESEYEACKLFIERVNHWENEKQLFDEVDALLQKYWPGHAFAQLVRGKFYTDYAWIGRTSKYASEVTPEQWKLFRERLEIAEAALRKGMEIDPKDGRLPEEMIRVVSGQEKGLDEMKKWFEKAMEADPNNFAACQRLLNFLLPRWYGSRDDMLAFGRACVASDKWGGTVPLALAEAHYMYNRNDGPPDGSYWTQPDVWPDLKAAYEKFFLLNPNAVSRHKFYARYACWCKQWDVFLDEVNLMGDVDYEFFNGQDEFEKNLAEAKKQVKK